MTQPDRDYDEILSRVLHSTLDPIEPAGDGLSKIQRRIAEPWLKRQWSLLLNELTALGWLILVRCEPYFNEARSSLAAFAVSSGRRLRSASVAASGAVARAASGQHRDAAGHDGLAGVVLRRWLGPTMTWLRPALAVAGAVVIVVAGVFTLSNFRATLFNTGASATNPSIVGSSPGAPNQQGNYGGRSSSQSASSHGSTGTSAARKPTSKPQGGGNATPSASPCSSSPAPTPSPSTTATPTPSPSATATPTPSPTPTGSPTSSGAPATSPAAAARELDAAADASCTPMPIIPGHGGIVRSS
jgi:hypothetical protein